MKTHNRRELATPPRIKFVTLWCRATACGTHAKKCCFVAAYDLPQQAADVARCVDSACIPCANCPSRQDVAGRLFCFSENFLTPTPNRKHHAPIPPRLKRDVSADRHDTWSAGCDGRDEHVRRTLFVAHVKACGPGLPTLRPSSRDDDLAGDGSKTARFPGRARYKR